MQVSPTTHEANGVASARRAKAAVGAAVHERFFVPGVSITTMKGYQKIILTFVTSICSRRPLPKKTLHLHGSPCRERPTARGSARLRDLICDQDSLSARLLR